MSERDDLKATLTALAVNGGEVSRSRLLSWMRHDDLEVQGQVYELLRDRRKLLRVVPPLDEREYRTFYRTHMVAVMGAELEPLSDLNNFAPAWDIAGWLRSLVDDSAVTPKTLDEFVDWLAAVYISSSPKVRTVLVTGALEHLFEDRRIRKLFAAWKSHPQLSAAYADAMMWVAKGGDSPIVGRRRSRSRKK